MKDKLMKISTLLIAFYIVFSVYSTVNADSLWQKISGQGSSFVEEGKKQAGNINMDESIDQVAGIASILTGIGVAVMMGVVAYMGIKYLTAGPEAKAKLKVQLIGVVVAGVVIFGAVEIWSIVVDIAEKF